MHFDELPLQLYQKFVQTNGGEERVTWEILAKGLLSRFDDRAFEDPMSELKEL